MNRKILRRILAAETSVLLLLAAAALILSYREGAVPVETEPPATQPPETQMPTQAPTQAPVQTQPVTQPATEPSTEPQPTVYTLTFAGDCTLGTLYQLYSASSCFPAVAGEDDTYPFANVQTWFASDDLTLVNLEGPLTEGGTPEDKRFVFRGSPDFARMLPAGSVEWVSLANNHTYDFGQSGYDSTRKALDGVGVAYAGDAESSLLTTERGLKVGIFALAFSVDREEMADAIAELRQQGAEIVIVSCHWGTEGSYHFDYSQEDLAHAAIDAGADIVYGHHPHVLQPIETYNGGIIYYSLGNFCFGGNSDPRDYDTALISQQVIREVDGTVHLGTYTAVPCSISSVDYPNNYQPTPAPEDSERYTRVLEKLSGSFTGPDLVTNYDDETEPATEPETTEPETTGQEPTEPQPSETAPEATDPPAPTSPPLPETPAEG